MFLPVLMEMTVELSVRRSDDVIGAVIFFESHMDGFRRVGPGEFPVSEDDREPGAAVKILRLGLRWQLRAAMIQDEPPVTEFFYDTAELMGEGHLWDKETRRLGSRKVFFQNLFLRLYLMNNLFFRERRQERVR